MARQDAILLLHKTLLGRRLELRKRLGKELEDLAQMYATRHNRVTWLTRLLIAAAEEMASKLAELESKELAQVERALKRLKSGTYGKCEVCSCKIPVMRLNALPYSTLCIKCQREIESEGGFRDGLTAGDWARIGEGGNPMEDRELRISDLEIDLSK